MLLTVGMTVQVAGHRFRRPPGHPYWTLSFFREGEMHLTVGEEQYVRRGPGVSLIAPRTPYSLELPTSHREYWAVLRPLPAWEALLRWPLNAAGVGYVALGEWPQLREMGDAWEALFVAYTQVGPGWNAVALNLLERVLVLLNLLNPLVGPPIRDARIAASLDYLREHATEALMVEELAAVASLSPSRFAHLFRAETGRTPIQVHEALRMERARDLLLTTNLPVSEVAAAMGYTNPFHFTMRFKRHTGRSPRAWRENPEG